MFERAKACLEKAKTSESGITEGFDGISKLESGGHNWNEGDMAILRKMFEKLKISDFRSRRS